MAIFVRGNNTRAIEAMASVTFVKFQAWNECVWKYVRSYNVPFLNMFYNTYVCFLQGVLIGEWE